MPTRFAVFLYEGVEPIDVGGTCGVLSMARRVVPDLEIITVASRPGPVTMASGLKVVAEEGIDDFSGADVLLVLGGPGWEEECGHPETLEFLRRASQDSLTVSVCTGALLLAAVGLLNGHKATTRRRAAPGEASAPITYMQSRYPAVEAAPALYVDAENVITGGGVSLAIDTTLYVVERVFGPQTADEVTELIEYTHAREANRNAFVEA